jgi:4-carboxymuconolactone decarboxylase
VEGGFADVYARPGLDLGHRQLVTVAALATLGGYERQLAVHLRGALNVGVSVEELFEALLQVGLYAGVPRALNVDYLADSAADTRPLTRPTAPAPAPGMARPQMCKLAPPPRVRT